MPGYDRHIDAATKAAVVMGVVAFGGSLWISGRLTLPVVAAATSIVSTLAGGQAPDVDVNSSIPRRRFDRLLQVLVGGGIVTVVYLGHARLLRITRWWVEWTGVTITATYVLGVAVGIATVGAILLVPPTVQRVMPTHRGPVHSLPFWLGVATVATLLLEAGLRLTGIDLLARGTVEASLAGGLLIGVTVHLSLDGEIASFLRS